VTSGTVEVEIEMSDRGIYQSLMGILPDFISKPDIFKGTDTGTERILEKWTKQF